MMLEPHYALTVLGTKAAESTILVAVREGLDRSEPLRLLMGVGRRARGGADPAVHDNGRQRSPR